MRATLLHNQEAGTGRGHSKRELLALLRRAGYRVRYASVKKSGWARLLDDPGDLLVIAGGDSTVLRALRRIDRRDVPLLLLPVGTANNIAASLGLTGTAAWILRRLKRAARKRLDVAVARFAGKAREHRFIESAGVGLFTRFLRQSAKTERTNSRGKRLDSGLERMLKLSRKTAAKRHRVVADGRDLSGRYLIAAAFNIRSIGPRLTLAPRASPGDARLDLLLVPEPSRAKLERYLEALLEDRSPRFPFPLRRARRIELGWERGTGYLDDRPWPKGGPARRKVILEITGRPFEVLVP